MNNKELADTVVALGVGCARLDKYQVAPVTDNVREYGSAKWFVRDWRVAGALMERMGRVIIESSGDGWLVHSVGGEAFWNESLPRAIIEACVEALT